MKTNYDLVKQMHKKFQIDNAGNHPRQLSREEAIFRCKAMYEELMEYIGSTFIIDENELNFEFNTFLNSIPFRDNNDWIEHQFDALLDLAVFTIGTAERQGFDWDEGFTRVMNANLQKELAGTNEASKRGFKRDLVKPAGWRAPDLSDLVAPVKGIIVLDGPDACGKTTLAEMFKDLYDAKVIHLTWSPEIEKHMDDYMTGNIEQAILYARNNLVIIDRCWLSEICYAEVFRGGTNWPGLSEACDKMLTDQNALTIMCMPINIQKGIDHFNEMKKERYEMYDNIDDIITTYFCLYHGIKRGEPLKSKHANKIMQEGGLKLRDDIENYDFNIEGTDMKSFCSFSVNRLKELQS